MKKLLAITLMVLCSASAAYAIDQNISASVSSTLSVEFATAADNVGYPLGADVSWLSVDPSGNDVRPSAHVVGKLDTGLVCKYNGSSGTWKLQAVVSGTLKDKISFYMPQAINKNTSANTTGTLYAGQPPAAGSAWPLIPNTTTTIYTAGDDNNNTPFGTLVGMDLGLKPAGIASGSSLSDKVTFTVIAT